MAIINVTPDSFSDGGEFLEPQSALNQANICLKEGADVLDIGAQSTRPGAVDVGIDEELKRLLPALRIIRNKHPHALLSVDTYLSQVAERALEAGADWINDISGGRRDPEMLKIVSQSRCPYVITHSRGDSRTMDKLTSYSDVCEDVFQGLLRRTDDAIKAGISKDLIIWDPGLGFAKTGAQNLLILRNLEKFSSQGFPLLIAPSRKKFIGIVLNETNPKERIWGTAAVVARCVQAKVSMVRVHDIAPILKTINMSSHLW